MTEAHDPLPVGEGVANPFLRITDARDLFEHRLDVRRSTAVQWPRQRADRRGQGRAAVCACRGDDPRGERRRVQSVLCGADPVRVDRLDVTWIGLAAPAQEELLGSGLPAGDDVVGYDVRLAVRDPRGAGDDGHHLRRQTTEVRARLLVRNLVELAEFPVTRQPRRLGLEIRGRVTGETCRLVRLRVRHLRLEVVVDE